MIDVDGIGLFHIPGCGQIAFFIDAVWVDDFVHGVAMISSARYRMPDGTRPVPGSWITCGSCGKRISSKHKPKLWRVR